MRHSTGNPTKAEAARMSAIKDGPCIACHKLGIPSRWPEIHHMLSGNRRRGHMATVGLCQWHHRGVPEPGWAGLQMLTRLGPSLANGSKPFRAMFGTDDELLDYQNRLLDGATNSLEDAA